MTGRPAATAETSYGMAKRHAFACEVIRAAAPERVLDVGCGTGGLLTHPLAREFPAVRFLGTDLDPASIDLARQSFRLPNLAFEARRIDDLDGTFDLIIASEVIEHVDDPVAFLGAVRRRLAPAGKVLLTVPNGFGPMEMTAFAENLLRLSGLFSVLRFFVRLVRRRPLSAAADSHGGLETVAVSPHINFFTFGDLHRLFAFTGLAPVRYRPRTVLCGLGFDQFISRFGGAGANARAADHLPPFCASDWMFVLEPCAPAGGNPGRAGRRGRLRRYLNERRHGLR